MKTAEKVKHTPEPWHVSGGRSYVTVSGEIVSSIARVRIDWNEGKANAALIAAAPDLLRELKHLVRFMEPVEQTGLNIPGLATLNGARAAISKAETTL